MSGPSPAQLQQALRRGAAAWPGVTVSAQAFAAHLSSRLSAGRDALDALHVEDLYLAFACAERQSAALSTFARLLHREVREAVRRMTGPAGMGEEVEQLLREKLLVGEAGHPPRILDYAGRGALDKWLRAAAVRTALTLRRSVRREAMVDEDELLELPAANQDPELRLIQATYRRAFSDAFQAALRHLTPHQRNVLRLQLLDGLNIDQIGAIYATHRSTAARWLARAREELLALTRRELGASLHLSPREVDSLLGQLQTQLDVSLRRLLCESIALDRGR